MNWIRVSDRLPAAEDFEPTGDVLMWNPLLPGVEVFRKEDAIDTMRDAWTHWCRIEPPEEAKP